MLQLWLCQSYQTEPNLRSISLRLADFYARQVTLQSMRVGNQIFMLQSHCAWATLWVWAVNQYFWCANISFYTLPQCPRGDALIVQNSIGDGCTCGCRQARIPFPKPCVRPHSATKQLKCHHFLADVALWDLKRLKTLSSEPLFIVRASTRVKFSAFSGVSCTGNQRLWKSL